VGNSLYPALKEKLAGHVHSIGTTDIVASPEVFLPEDRELLLVSFARSGNSPESVGAVKAAERVCNKVKHIFITCNSEGELAKLAREKDNCFSIILTPETHDRSFAMTSSFTNMYLAALIAFKGVEELKLDEVIEASKSFIEEGYKVYKSFVEENDFDRVVYLGTDILKGIAQESALKILELTAGQIVPIYDTPMGFRHGPKSIINDRTLCVVYMSNNKKTRRYEEDVRKELEADGRGLLLTIEDDLGLSNCELALDYIVRAQAIAFFCSLKVNLTPDNPCPTGEVNRVVKGVTIYE
ncbi:MAG: SIS domain-containing protein, partial [Bacillota bacterium]|nr:SIS domain-containing protein [Bacillota bacterium]